MWFWRLVGRDCLEGVDRLLAIALAYLYSCLGIYNDERDYPSSYFFNSMLPYTHVGIASSWWTVSVYLILCFYLFESILKNLFILINILYCY